MKNLFTLSIALLLGFNSFAQVNANEKLLKAKTKGSTDSTKVWNKGGVFNLGFGQATLVNWAAGGLNSQSFNGLLSLFANRSVGKIDWDNTLDLEFGTISQYAPGQGDNATWIKNADRIELTSKVGMEASKKWNYALLLNFRSQLTEGYDAAQKVIISDFTSPAYTTLALGMDYKPIENLSLFVSPATYRITMVARKNLRESYGFTHTEAEAGSILGEAGAYLKAKYKKNKPFGLDNIAFQTDLALFSEYKAITYVDVYWNTLISMKVNKYISANIGTNLIYDHDIQINTGKTRADGTPEIGPRVQFKEALTIGFSYKF